MVGSRHNEYLVLQRDLEFHANSVIPWSEEVCMCWHVPILEVKAVICSILQASFYSHLHTVISESASAEQAHCWAIISSK